MIDGTDDFDESIPDEPIPDFEPDDEPEHTDIGDFVPSDEDMGGIEDVFENEGAGGPYPETDAGDSGGREDAYPGEAFPENQDQPEPEDRVSDTVQKEQPVEPFVSRKSSAASALGGGHPYKLNYQFILSVVVGAFALIVVFATFIIPLFKQQKSERAAKPKAVAVRPSDYSAMVPKKETPVEEGYEDLDQTIEELPPVNPRYHYEEPQPQPAVSGGTPAVSERPNTRADRLQAKTISGIKGITPSQRNYLSGPGAVPQTYQQTPNTADPANPYAQYGLPSKEQYTSQLLSAYQGANANSYSRQNDQSNKTLFYNQGRENSGNGYWLGPAALWQGTIFEATLTSNINTDLPGEATAWVTKNIYSSLDGRYLLIPQNSRLFGTYNSSISYSQSRVQVGWHTLIRPDGYMINLGAMQATDPQGAAGLKGFINDHPFQYLKALALLTAFNILNLELNANTANTENQYVQNVMANSQEIANTIGSKLIDRALDVQPTITIKAGTKINIVVNTNLALPPLPPYEVTMPYHRGE